MLKEWTKLWGQFLSFLPEILNAKLSNNYKYPFQSKIFLALPNFKPQNTFKELKKFNGIRSNLSNVFSLFLQYLANLKTIYTLVQRYLFFIITFIFNLNICFIIIPVILFITVYFLDYYFLSFLRFKRAFGTLFHFSDWPGCD